LTTPTFVYLEPCTYRKS